MKKKELAKMALSYDSPYEDMVPSIIILPRLELAYENGFLEYLNETEKKKFLQLYKLADYWHDKYMEIEEEIEKLQNTGWQPDPNGWQPKSFRSNSQKRKNRR
tara:strand:+ start:925 stop:1233 length:309 start_codon:yes stop_codon:yes gene_type:complete